MEQSEPPASDATPWRASSWSSLRLRLPLLVSSLVVVVVGALLWIAHREVEANLLRSAATGMRSAAAQVALLVSQSTQQGLIEGRRAASHSSVRAALLSATTASRQATEAYFGSFPSPVHQRIEIWNSSGERLVSVALPPGQDSIPALETPPSTPGPGELQVSERGVVFGQTVVDVVVPADDGLPVGNEVRIGFLVVRRAMASNADAINRLVGQDTVIEVGNRSGNVWTDSSKVIAAPPLEALRAGAVEYRGADGARRLGVLADVQGTPWTIFLGRPRSSAVAPARVFLRRMIVISLGLVGIVTAFVVAAAWRLTTPLRELTRASEAMAAGDYSRRVAARTRDEVGRLSATFNEMAGRTERAHTELEARVAQRTRHLEEARAELEDHAGELATVNKELEAFSYSVSHDLRAPLRHISGFASILTESHAQSLGEEGRRHLRTITEAAARMGRLIDDLLAFSRVGRSQLVRRPVNLGLLVREVKEEVSAAARSRQITWSIGALPSVDADPSLLRLVLVNLCSNAVKYTAPRSTAEVEIAAQQGDGGDTVISVRDNGVGFDMKYADKLFGVFQRLHSNDEFEGVGIGLANVRRIVQRHGGRTWAEGAVDKGATFYFSLPLAEGQRIV